MKRHKYIIAMLLTGSIWLTGCNNEDISNDSDLTGIDVPQELPRTDNELYRMSIYCFMNSKMTGLRINYIRTQTNLPKPMKEVVQLGL